MAGDPSQSKEGRELAMKRGSKKYEQLPIVLNADDVQSILGCSHGKALELFHAEDFPYLDIMKRCLVLKESFFTWMESRKAVKK